MPDPTRKWLDATSQTGRDGVEAKARNGVTEVSAFSLTLLTFRCDTTTNKKNKKKIFSTVIGILILVFLRIWS